ncbi:type II toxin-antitoxin system VapC family toxin [Granulicella sp. WH15]|uniref:type II toxin-antitoxin system VapC family toxin n=1 Tax=Granulicella sp. WH15 TaxID=2602070 RepID=UPI002104A02E|nr:type II toxin-antitoxin system VapC family toxin [Granulicella sp. WH15]
MLDTHALLWAALSPKTLGRRAAKIVADEANVILVSAASAWEISTKVRLGKIPEAEAFERNFLEAVDEAGYTLLPIGIDHALRAGRLVGEHRDPFDRMLAAQALAEDIPIISADAQLDSFQVQRIW